MSSDDEITELARQAAEAVYSRDSAAKALGIEIVEIKPGFARLSMTVSDWMLQGHGICHGGLVFALADTALAFASNSHNEVHVTLSANIDYLRPAQAGDVLIAEAHEGDRTRRTGMYDVTVINQTGSRVCHLRGRTYGIGDPVIEVSHE